MRVEIVTYCIQYFRTIMRRYVLWWAAIFFSVIFLSLYLMLEMLNADKPKKSLASSAQRTIEEKLRIVEYELRRNKEIISNIKSWVTLLAKRDSLAIGRLPDLAVRKNVDPADRKENAMRGKLASEGAHGHGINSVGKTDEELAVHPNKENIYSQFDNGRRHGNEVCSLATRRMKDADIDNHQLMQSIPFDNPDGGVWKQGWNVEYNISQWKDKKLKIIVVPHSHCDPGWLITYAEYYKKHVRSILENMLVKLEAYPDLKFVFAEISFFSVWWDELDSAKKERVKRLIRAGQLEIVTGGWVMNDEANTHYYAIINQLMEGHQWLNRTLGVKPKNGWAIDPFGHSSTMAYLLRRAGLENMVIQRVHYSMKKHLARQRNLEFMWRQHWDDAHTTDILCHMMPFYSYDVPHTCGPDPRVCCQFDFRRLSELKPGRSCPWGVQPLVVTPENVGERARMLLDQYRKKSQLFKTDIVLIPLGDDFRYDLPLEWDMQFQNYRRLFDYINSNDELRAEAKFGTLADYFSELRREVTHPSKYFPSLSGDFFSYADRDEHYWTGYYTSRPFHKHLDRVLESNLRAAEIVFTLALGYAQRHQMVFLSDSLMERLVLARRSLALFQHHDGITGTAKNNVVIDYGHRLLAGLVAAKEVMLESASFLAHNDRSAFKKGSGAFILDMDETRQNHDSLPVRNVIQLGNGPRSVMLFNSLAHRRQNVVTVWTSEVLVEVRDPDGHAVPAQCEPVWKEGRLQPEPSPIKVSFIATVPALGFAVYTLSSIPGASSLRNQLVATTFLNAGSGDIDSGHFQVKKEDSGQDFTIANSEMLATFSGVTGFLKTVRKSSSGKLHTVHIQVIRYGTRKEAPRHARDKERSGAYLFLPDREATVVEIGKPVVMITRGKLTSEVQVFTNSLHHSVRLAHTDGIESTYLEIRNLVDIRNTSNCEVGLRFETDVLNRERVFFTDLNGFQMVRRQTLDKLPLQANLYPMSTGMFIQDSAKTRLSILTVQSLGVSVLKPGQVDIMLDRRLNQDDNRGLFQAVMDNRVTPSCFRLLIESPTVTVKAQAPSAYPSALSNHLSLQLAHPIFLLPVSVRSAGAGVLHRLLFAPLKADFPCELHLLSLRSLQQADAHPARHGSSALLVHHIGTDCDFRMRGMTCLQGNGQVDRDMFAELTFADITETSLTLMHELEDLGAVVNLTVPAMEIKAFRITLS